VGVAAEVVEDVLGPAEGRLGVDDPVDLVEAIEEGVPVSGPSKFRAPDMRDKNR
jgi:hypothetical protein